MVLVVEDDPDIREVVCKILREDGYETVGTCNGKEALDYLHSQAAPSVILLDLSMPVMDGYQFLRAKEADPALADLPVVVMSAATGCKERLRQHHVRLCISKPLSMRTLLEAIAPRAG